MQYASLGFKFICVNHSNLSYYISADCEFNFSCRPTMIQQVIINYEFDTNLGLLLFDCISFVLAKTARELASILHRSVVKNGNLSLIFPIKCDSNFNCFALILDLLLNYCFLYFILLVSLFIHLQHHVK